ncbi:MAG: carbamoyl phosphate synthase small subunit [Firmicutes bacterium]|nr:carbamoyl phosphate synthase small subunit [Bacillota bacterium]
MDFGSSKAAYLILSDGTVFKGKSFGTEGTVIGETVFTTAMTGYQETLTDPSYCGQIVTQTFPLIGNYGVNSIDYESRGSVVSGYVVREKCDVPSNFRCEDSIESFLKKYGIIGIYDIDTRRLTQIIRETGVMNGMITTEEFQLEKALEEIKLYKVGKVVPKVSTDKPERFEAENSRFNVVLMDYGYKYNIRRELVKRGCNVTVMPWDTDAEEICALDPDGIMLSNGPGDPTENAEAIETLKKLIEKKIPTFGICLGHQLMALANGGKTIKLKYGHRGGNQPVTDLDLDRTFVTSQNHGYAVVNDSISPEVGKVSHINANDGTCEGVRYINAPAFTVQFHPEACGGPQDTAYLFDEFIELMEEHK